MNAIQTFQFGEINIDQDRMIDFPQGLPGFEDSRHFILCHEEGSEGIVHFLQSAEDGELVFSVADPAQFGIHYQFTLTDEEQAVLELTDMSDLLVLILLYRTAEEPSTSPDSIQGAFTLPLIVNVKARKGLQKIMPTLTPSVLLSEISSPVAD